MNITLREEYLPLTPQALHILLSLSENQNTGYQLKIAIREDTHGSIELSSGSIYPTLKRMCHFGLVEALNPAFGPGPQGIKQVYRLTPEGWGAIEHELNRLERTITLGRARLANRVQYTQP